jgi:hypothetical protein
MAESPEPDRLVAPDLTVAVPVPSSASGQERTAPACAGEVPSEAATPALSPTARDRLGDSSGSPVEPEYRSMVSLTRGPSQVRARPHVLPADARFRVLSAAFAALPGPAALLGLMSRGIPNPHMAAFF